MESNEAPGEPMGMNAPTRHRAVAKGTYWRMASSHGRASWHGHAPGLRHGFEWFYGDSFIIFHSVVFPFRESILERDFRVSLESCYLCFWIEFTKIEDCLTLIQ